MVGQFWSLTLGPHFRRETKNFYIRQLVIRSRSKFKCYEHLNIVCCELTSTLRIYLHYLKLAPISRCLNIHTDACMCSLPSSVVCCIPSNLPHFLRKYFNNKQRIYINFLNPRSYKDYVKFTKL